MFTSPPSKILSRRRGRPWLNAASVAPRRTLCAVYANRPMLAGAILTLGSVRRFEPAGAQCLLFTDDAAPRVAPAGVEFRSIDRAVMRATGCDPVAWSNAYPGAVGHFFRKSAMWVEVLETAAVEGIDRVAFLDADVFFFGGLGPIHYVLDRYDAAAYQERWWSLDVHLQAMAPHYRSAIECRYGAAHRFLGLAYYNAGVIFARTARPFVDACRDVIECTRSLPQLALELPMPEQTLLNFSLVRNGLTVCDLGSLCPPAYDERADPANPPIAVHYMGDAQSRRPSVLMQRYPREVERALQALSITRETLEAAGLWN